MAIPKSHNFLAWQDPLGAIQKEGVRLIRTCQGPCDFYEVQDVDALVDLLGAEFSLIDQRPPCPKCERRNHFMVSPGKGTPFRPLVSRDAGPEPYRPAEGWAPWPDPRDIKGSSQS